nr:uncharacterized protein LOC110194668 isoform X2 [Phascolarctos cinereus]
MKAKFTLSAYLACWLILKLCKKAYEQRPHSSKQTPEPAEPYTGDVELEDNQLLSATVDVDKQRLSQETDEDYFETQSHQSECPSDVKTEPFESASDTDSLPSDITAETYSSPYLLACEKEAVCDVSSDVGAANSPQEFHLADAQGLGSEQQVKLPPDLKGSTCRGEIIFSAGTEKGQTEETEWSSQSRTPSCLLNLCL